MVKRYLKRIVGMCLAFVMVFSLSTPAFADSVKARSSAALTSDETVLFLDMHYIKKENLISIEGKKGAEQKYIYQLTDTVRSEISVQKKENSHVLTIKEGSLVNTLEITRDGRYILDGNIVTVSGEDILINSNEGIAVPLYATDMYYTDVCPYGAASDYTKFVRKVKKSDISFGKPIIDIALTAFTTIVGAGVNPILGLSVSFVSAILLSMQSYDPHSMCVSYEEDQYVHKTKGSFVTLEKSVLMYDMEWWPVADFGENNPDINSYKTKAYQVTLWEKGEA